MTINITELRRLAQAATPGPWVAAGPSFGESLPKYLNEVAVDREGDEDDGYSICNAPIGLNEECSDDMAFIAEANPLTIEALLDRLEAAEKSRDDLLACLGEWLDKTKWVQQGANEGTISAKYLGLHRADVMSSLLGEAEKERDFAKAEIARLHDDIRELTPSANGAANGKARNVKLKPAGYKTARGQFYGSLTAMPSHERSTAKVLHELPEIDVETIRQIIEAAVVEHVQGGDLWLCTNLAAKKVQEALSSSAN